MLNNRTEADMDQQMEQYRANSGVGISGNGGNGGKRRECFVAHSSPMFFAGAHLQTLSPVNEPQTVTVLLRISLF